MEAVMNIQTVRLLLCLGLIGVLTSASRVVFVPEEIDVPFAPLCRFSALLLKEHTDL